MVMKSELFNRTFVLSRFFRPQARSQVSTDGVSLPQLESSLGNNFKEISLRSNKSSARLLVILF